MDVRASVSLDSVDIGATVSTSQLLKFKCSNRIRDISSTIGARAFSDNRTSPSRTCSINRISDASGSSDTSGAGGTSGTNGPTRTYSMRSARNTRSVWCQ